MISTGHARRLKKLSAHFLVREEFSVSHESYGSYKSYCVAQPFPTLTDPYDLYDLYDLFDSFDLLTFVIYLVVIAKYICLL